MTAPLMPRLPVSAASRLRMARAATGRKHTQETKDRIAEARRGRKHTQETKDRISASMADKSPEAEARRAKARKLAKDAWKLPCYKRWRADIRIARLIGDRALIDDVVKSGGWWARRRIHHPYVSDGFWKGKAQWWNPRNLDERVRLGMIKGYHRHNRKRSRARGFQTTSGS